MRKLKVTTFVTLDGVMQSPGGPDEDRSGGFTNGGWSVGYWDDRMGQVMGEFMGRPFELLLGRRTYEIFAAYWPHSSEPGAEALNSARKHVASRTLKNVEWNNSALIKGDVPMYVSELKKQSGPEIQVHGSGDLIQTLLRNDLVDEFHLWTFPAVLGSGKRLFAGGAIPAGLKVVDVTTSSTGVVIATYERAGEIKYWSFALDEPSVDHLERTIEVGREQLVDGAVAGHAVVGVEATALTLAHDGGDDALPVLAELDQSCDRDAERVGDPHQRREGRVAETPLELAQRAKTAAASGRHFLERQPSV